MAITAALVKELRETSGAGMMDCKKALTETNGNLEEAQDWLRTKGLAAAAKKASRVASEGLVAIAVKGNKGAVVEVNAETDFVSRNDTFQSFVNNVAQVALEIGDDLEAVKAAAYPGEDRTVEEQLTHLIATIGENMNLRRIEVLTVENGVVASYMHNALTGSLGKIGVLVGLEGEGADLEATGKQIAMHIAATKPQSIGRDDLDPEVVEKERKVLVDQAIESGKPEEIAKKMVEGRIRKFYEEVCLLEQTFVIDGESKVADVVAKAGDGVKLSAFSMFALGDGIEKEEEDYAAEVAKMAGA